MMKLSDPTARLMSKNGIFLRSVKMARGKSFKLPPKPALGTNSDPFCVDGFLWCLNLFAPSKVKMKEQRAINP